MTIYKIFRSSQDKLIAGVCSGLAKNLSVNPWVIRSLFLALVLFFGISILVYFIAWVVIPKARDVSPKPEMIFGVCSELAYRFNIDVSLLRIVVVMISLSSMGIAIIAYLLTAIYFSVSRSRTLPKESIINTER